jgi:hypothetical protein
MASHARKIRRLTEKKLQKAKDSRSMIRRYIKLLPDINVMTLDGDKPYFVDKDGKAQPLSHRKYIKGRCTDAAFITRGFSGSCKAAAIIAAVEPLEPGDVLVVDHDDWEILKEAVEHPRVQAGDGRIIEAGFDGIAGPQIVPFGRAILDAKTEDPRKTENTDPASPNPAS